MTRVVYLPDADADLIDIYVWIAQENPEAAARLVQRLVAAVRRLADFPESAPIRPDIVPGVPSLVVGRYLVLYRVEADRIDVVRVVHGSRDVAALLDD